MIKVVFCCNYFLDNFWVGPHMFIVPQSILHDKLVFQSLQSERIRYWGYCCEEYEILTEDGYYLKVNRIPGGKIKTKAETKIEGLDTFWETEQSCLFTSTPLHLFLEEKQYRNATSHPTQFYAILIL